MFLPWRRFSSCSFSHRVASGCRSNEGLLRLLIISHCVLHFDVPKVIVIDVFDDKTVSYSFFPSSLAMKTGISDFMVLTWVMKFKDIPNWLFS